jgi:hypothetical protein
MNPVPGGVMADPLAVMMSVFLIRTRATLAANRDFLDHI